MKQRDIFFKFPHWLQLVCFTLVFIGCLLIFGNAAALLSVLIFGAEASGTASSLLFVQGISMCGGFLLPSLWFAYMQRAAYPDFLQLRTQISIKFLLLGVGAYLLFSPFVAAIQEWNAGIHFPETWQSLETYLREKSLQAEALSKQMLLTNHPGTFVFALLVVGFGAGLCEEFFFRGCLQNLFKSWFKNAHAAIWTAAAVFSLFHGDFFGFLPRLFLGAFLGYLYFWSGSLWVSVMVHALNNTILVVVYFLHHNHLIAFNPESLEHSPQWFVVLPCLLVFALLCRKMSRNSL